MLCQLPGFSNFKSAQEVLHCYKPGTGSVDALRAWSLKIKELLKGKRGVTVSLVENELLMCHKNAYDGILTLIGLVGKIAILPQFIACSSAGDCSTHQAK